MSRRGGGGGFGLGEDDGRMASEGAKGKEGIERERSSSSEEGAPHATDRATRSGEREKEVVRQRRKKYSLPRHIAYK
jgi:hypothetical protein